MDDWIGTVRQMKPLPGFDRAELPGGMEWAWERENRRQGIPVGPQHQETLEGVAARAGVEAPFSQFEHTRY